MTLTIEEIVAVRKANRMRQIDLAELLDMPVGTWSNVELGNQPLYANLGAKIEKLFHELNCDMSVLENEEAMHNLPDKIFIQQRGRKTKPQEAEKVTESNVDMDKIRGMVQDSIAVVQGVGKDEPVVTNEKGGGQSKVHYRLDLIDPKALFATAKVLKEGADKYGAENWRLIDIDDHLNHLLIHAYAYLAGDTSDEHLSHIVCRALFALGVDLQTEKDIEKLNQSGE